MATDNTTNSTVRTAQKDDFIRLQDLFYLCLAKWYWIVISLGITIVLPLSICSRPPPSYTRSASILIKEDAKGNAISGDISSTFADMGLFQSSTNVNNELISLRSPAVMLDVVKRLHLDINYRTDGTFYKRTLYGSELPYTVSFPKITDSEAVSLTMNVKDDGAVTLQDFIYYRNGEKQEDNATVVSGMPGDTLRTPAGLVIVTPTPYRDTAEKVTLYITRYSASHGCGELFAESYRIA
jgi:tyrosine-protein kinase Etk/Wzc